MEDKLWKIRKAASGFIFMMVVAVIMMVYFATFTIIPMKEYIWWAIILVSPSIGNLLNEIF